MFKTDLLAGKKILITGGGTGLGKSIGCLLYTSPSPRD